MDRFVAKYISFMKLSNAVKKVREAKGMTQKEVASVLKMDASQYSRIENGKNDPSFTVVTKIAKALGVTVAELVQADEIFTETHSHDKTIMEKLRLLDSLEEKDKQSLYHIIDTFVTKKKLKDNLSNVLQLAQ
jgi:transcriptional regulator with XRE-family HTH domain